MRDSAELERAFRQAGWRRREGSNHVAFDCPCHRHTFYLKRTTFHARGKLNALAMLRRMDCPYRPTLLLR